MSNDRPEFLGDVIIRVMDTLNSRRQEMCDFFDDFDDFFDDGMDSEDPDIDDDLNQDDDQNDGFDAEDAFFTGSLIGYAYEEGRREKRKRKDTDSEDPSDID